jgi:salicylate hydroxylase
MTKRKRILTKTVQIGAGLQFSANATRILMQWGIDKTIAGDVVEPHSCIMRCWKDGRKLASVPLHAYHREAYGAPFWDIHRHDLLKALYNRSLELGADINVNSRVVDIDFEQGIVLLQNGESIQGDLVVGADGLHSLCRKKLFKDEAPEYTGDIAFRVLLNIADLPQEDPDFQRLLQDPQVNYWLGPSGHAIVYILKGGKQINLVAIAPDDLPPGIVRQPCSAEEAIDIFMNWDPL